MLDRRRVILGTLGLSVGGLTAPARALTLTPMWIYVAPAPVIVQATPKAMSWETDNYAEATLAAVTPLRGLADEGATIRQGRGRGTAGSLIASDGASCILFATRSSTEGDDKLYLLSDPLPAAARYEVQAEIEAERRLLAEWRPDPSLPHYAEVQTLIQTAATRADGEDEAFRRLEALGPTAVLAIIDLMDDRRPLPQQRLSLRNRMPDAFEGTRYYGPKCMVDALAAILNQLTGQSFGDIQNGGSEAERQATVDGWRIYAWHTRH